jgi:flagellar biosynthetic protein FlhB
MAEETAQERTEEPTPKRREDARKKGQVARSRDFNTTVSLLAGGAGCLILGPAMLTEIVAMLGSGLALERNLVFDAEAPQRLFYDAMLAAGFALAPLLALLFACSLLGPMALGGFSISAEALQPKLERINPIKGLGRIFSANGLVELLKAILKFLLVGAVAALCLWQLTGWLMALGLGPVELSMAQVGPRFAWCFLMISSAMLLVAMIDVPFQLWDHTRKLRMTRQEIKDEMKESEGRPEVKGHIRRLQQQAAQQRMMQDVPTADVVITNPTHFAVALRYVDGEMSAPVVVAKGRDLVAARIREVAAAHRVTVFSAPPLARALYAGADIGEEIPAELFVAVARVLAYVYQLRNAGDYGPRVTPPDPDSLTPKPSAD